VIVGFTDWKFGADVDVLGAVFASWALGAGVEAGLVVFTVCALEAGVDVTVDVFTIRVFVAVAVTFAGCAFNVAANAGASAPEILVPAVLMLEALVLVVLMLEAGLAVGDVALLAKVRRLVLHRLARHRSSSVC
jgi:hypothetical protein